MRKRMTLERLVLVGASIFTGAGAVSAGDNDSAIVDGPAPIDEAAAAEILAVSDDTAYGEYLAGECAGCHEQDAADDAAVPGIHGKAALFIAAALADYRSGARDNTTMGNIAINLADEEIAVLSHYLASVTP